MYGIATPIPPVPNNINDGDNLKTRSIIRSCQRKILEEPQHLRWIALSGVIVLYIPVYLYPLATSRLSFTYATGTPVHIRLCWPRNGARNSQRTMLTYAFFFLF